MNKIKYYISDVSDGNIALHIGDNEDKVIQNRKNIASKLGFNLEDFVYLDQVHSDKVITKYNSSLNSYSLQQQETADALVTKEKSVVLSIMVADCVPIILYDDVNGVIGNVHAGWKGTSKNILKNTISKMLDLGANIENIKMLIGPSISSCSYEVGEEVGVNFREEVKTKLIKGKQYLDLKLENKIQALEYGLKESNIEDIKIDTFSDDNYFSARRDGYAGGRFGAFIWIN